MSNKLFYLQLSISVCEFSSDIKPTMAMVAVLFLTAWRGLLQICSAAPYLLKGACFPRCEREKLELKLLSWFASACSLFSAYRNPIHFTCPFSEQSQGFLLRVGVPR